MKKTVIRDLLQVPFSKAASWEGSRGGREGRREKDPGTPVKVTACPASVDNASLYQCP